MSTWYRADAAVGRLTTTATGCPDLQRLEGRLVGIKIADDLGHTGKGIPPHRRLIVDLGSGVVVVRVNGLADAQRPLDQHSDRALLSLASCRSGEPCVCTIEVDRSGDRWPCFSTDGTPRIPKSLRGQSPAKTLAMADEIRRAVLLNEAVRVPVTAEDEWS